MMSVSRIIKRIAYSVSFLNPGVSSLDNMDAMPLWIGVIVCILLLVIVGLLILVVASRLFNY